MCGRTACTLAPDEVVKACRYHDKLGHKREPLWHDAPGGQQYYTSYNIAPGSHTPVLLSGRHVHDVSSGDRVIQPMQWGLVPSWHKGSPKDVMYNMNNARSDTMLSKRSFKVPLEKRQRCVVLAEGYFEWQATKDKKKQPYFLYFGETKSEKNEGAEDDSNDDKNGQGLLTMAGVFDIWTPSEGGEPLYSYSVITTDAAPSVAHIHHRMPAILTNEEEIRQWLDIENVPLKEAVELIKPKDCLQLHPVSTVVNNSRNNTPECIKVIDLQAEKKPSASSNLMMQWLSGKTSSPQKKLPETTDIKKEDIKELEKNVKQENGDQPVQVKREATETLLNPVAKKHRLS